MFITKENQTFLKDWFQTPVINNYQIKCNSISESSITLHFYDKFQTLQLKTLLLDFRFLKFERIGEGELFWKNKKSNILSSIISLLEDEKPNVYFLPGGELETLALQALLQLEKEDIVAYVELIRMISPSTLKNPDNAQYLLNVSKVPVFFSFDQNLQFLLSLCKLIYLQDSFYLEMAFSLFGAVLHFWDYVISSKDQASEVEREFLKTSMDCFYNRDKITFLPVSYLSESVDSENSLKLKGEMVISDISVFESILRPQLFETIQYFAKSMKTDFVNAFVTFIQKSGWSLFFLNLSSWKSVRQFRISSGKLFYEVQVEDPDCSGKPFYFSFASVDHVEEDLKEDLNTKGETREFYGRDFLVRGTENSFLIYRLPGSLKDSNKEYDYSRPCGKCEHGQLQLTTQVHLKDGTHLLYLPFYLDKLGGEYYHCVNNHHFWTFGDYFADKVENVVPHW